MNENTGLENINLAEWYNSTQAAAIISKNSNKVVSSDYLRKLAEYGKIKKVRISDRANLYWKADVDKYRVEERGVKSGRAKKAKATKSVPDDKQPEMDDWWKNEATS